MHTCVSFAHAVSGKKWTPKQVAIIQQNLVRFVWNFTHANF